MDSFAGRRPLRSRFRATERPARRRHFLATPSAQAVAIGTALAGIHVFAVRAQASGHAPTLPRDMDHASQPQDVGTALVGTQAAGSRQDDLGLCTAPADPRPRSLGTKRLAIPTIDGWAAVQSERCSCRPCHLLSLHAEPPPLRQVTIQRQRRRQPPPAMQGEQPLHGGLGGMLRGRGERRGRG